ncbi:hypothetical protein HC776_01780 [bacterium]|nr:hypothetical protein [bacterium]
MNRVTGFSYKRFEGAVPTIDTLQEMDTALIARIESGFESVGTLIEKVKLREALAEAMSLVREVNGYLDKREPWKMIKVDAADAAPFDLYGAARDRQSQHSAGTVFAVQRSDRA